MFLSIVSITFGIVVFIIDLLMFYFFNLSIEQISENQNYLIDSIKSVFHDKFDSF